MATMQRITASLYQISLGLVNVFVLKDNGLTLIDTGYKGSMAPIFQALRKGGENPGTIRQIILTHAHPDHAGSAAAIKKELGIPLLAHQNEAPTLEKGTGGGAPIHVSPGVVNWLIYQLFIKRGGGGIDPVSVDQYVSDGDVLPVCDSFIRNHESGGWVER